MWLYPRGRPEAARRIPKEFTGPIEILDNFSLLRAVLVEVSGTRRYRISLLFADIVSEKCGYDFASTEGGGSDGTGHASVHALSPTVEGTPGKPDSTARASGGNSGKHQDVNVSNAGATCAAEGMKGEL